MKPLFVDDELFEKLYKISKRNGVWSSINDLIKEAINDLEKKYKDKKI